MKIALISFTAGGIVLNTKLQEMLKEHEIKAYSIARYISDKNTLPIKDLGKVVERHFCDDAIIFIGAAGIAVRSIAPFLKDKFSDPGVIVIDEVGNFVIPLLSGHVGGANELAEYIAKCLSSKAVITTATDVRGVFAVDVFAKKHNLILSSKELAKKVSVAVLDKKPVDFYSDIKEINVESIGRILNPLNAETHIKVRITNRICEKNVLTLIPKNLSLGVGCKRGISPEKLWDFVNEVFKENSLDIRAVRNIASIDIKKEEKAIVELSKRLAVNFYTYSKEELEAAKGDFSESEFVKKTVGVGNVCERAALTGTRSLLVKKRAKDGMTLAIGEY